ncbi:hypothetical protein XCR_4024 [Xanthomonas campestris pv. raphani 756C]|nr:hypothetical protein XCR_4024 [Xanthomonas campestris pv. raphani 756C]
MNAGGRSHGRGLRTGRSVIGGVVCQSIAGPHAGAQPAVIR